MLAMISIPAHTSIARMISFLTLCVSCIHKSTPKAASTDKQNENINIESVGLLDDMIGIENE